MRTALVTGGNRGLGLETCRQLAARGLRVLQTSRGEAEVADGIEHRPLDVTNAASIAALAASLARDGVRLDVLVNNAGIYHDRGDAALARRTLDVNLHGPRCVTEALLPCMRDGGNVVMVSSGLGELSSFTPSRRERLLAPGLTTDELVALMESYLRDRTGWPTSPYVVSKAGLNALTRILARDLQPRRIRVNAVCPGWVRTDMGGANATRNVDQGAASIVWAAAAEDGPTGGFFRDGQAIDW